MLFPGDSVCNYVISALRRGDSRCFFRVRLLLLHDGSKMADLVSSAEWHEVCSVMAWELLSCLLYPCRGSWTKVIAVWKPFGWEFCRRISPTCNGFWDSPEACSFFLLARLFFALSLVQQSNACQGRHFFESSRSRMMTHHTACGTPLDEWSASRRGQPYMPAEGIEPAVSASDRPQTLARHTLGSFSCTVLSKKVVYNKSVSIAFQKCGTFKVFWERSHDVKYRVWVHKSRPSRAPCYSILFGGSSAWDFFLVTVLAPRTRDHKFSKY
jgi:hypothetical protein